MATKGLPIAAVSLLALASLAIVVTDRQPDPESSTSPVLLARIVDENGRTLAGTEVRVGAGDSVRTDGDGYVRAPLQDNGPQLVRVAAEGRLSRTLAVQPGDPVEVRLTSRAADTVSVRFGGDVMFGRRYYDRDGDGDRRDGLLAPGASVEDHAELLTHVAPLLEDADLTVVNLESPVSEDPWFDPTRPRPPGFLEDKDLAFASAPESVHALAEVGVDVVALGNNHVYDATDDGLALTLATLDEAGIARFGAGRTVDEAWTPAIVERKGQRLAFLGCTTVSGYDQSIANVVTEEHGGAAACAEERLRNEVLSAAATADVVVVMIHGGQEYQAEPSGIAERFTAIAEQAGADLVVNGHPHVVGEVSLQEGRLRAETLGNLLFDQDVWPTFLSYLLRVDVRDAGPVLATVDPLFIEDYVPRPTVGLLADAAARRAAGPDGGPGPRLQPPGAVFTHDGVGDSRLAERPLERGMVRRLSPAWWVPRDGRPDAASRLGQELLWTGSFEDMDTDPATIGAHAWSLGLHARLRPEAACSGSVGLELSRSPLSTRDVVASPAHRQLVSPGSDLSLVADVRDASPGATLELRWYPAAQGGSTSVTSLPIPVLAEDRDGCTQIRLDATVPDGIVAVQPFIRLVPADDNFRGPRLAVDNVQLVAWSDEGSGRMFEVVEGGVDVALPLADDSPLPGDPFAFSGSP